jgi:hypothetical protein
MTVEIVQRSSGNRVVPYVAKKVNAWTTLQRSQIGKFTIYALAFAPIMDSAMACAIPTPSLGEVPRPSSSMRTRDPDVIKPIVTLNEHRPEEHENDHTEN